jgi:hypothetical protein
VRRGMLTPQGTGGMSGNTPKRKSIPSKSRRRRLGGSASPSAGAGRPTWSGEGPLATAKTLVAPGVASGAFASDKNHWLAVANGNSGDCGVVERVVDAADEGCRSVRLANVDGEGELVDVIVGHEQASLVLTAVDEERLEDGFDGVSPKELAHVPRGSRDGPRIQLVQALRSFLAGLSALGLDGGEHGGLLVERGAIAWVAFVGNWGCNL